MAPPHVQGNADQDPARAAWLQLGKGRLWEERVRDVGAVVSRRSAAHVRSLGDLIPRVHEFYVPTRVRLRRTDLRLRVQPRTARSDWSLSGGMPVCTIQKVVADLVADHEDESAVAQIVRDGIRDGLLGRDELDRAAARAESTMDTGRLPSSPRRCSPTGRNEDGTFPRYVPRAGPDRRMVVFGLWSTI